MSFEFKIFNKDDKFTQFLKEKQSREYSFIQVNQLWWGKSTLESLLSNTLIKKYSLILEND